MPDGEEMFKFHGYSGPCPKPPLPSRDETLSQPSVFDDRRDLDDDLPESVRRELVQAAVANGRVSYHWLGAIYRRGRTDGTAEAMKVRDLLREWQEARKPAKLAEPGVDLAATYQAAVKRMAAADEALAAYNLNGPAGGAPVGQTEPTENTGTCFLCDGTGNEGDEKKRGH